MWGWGLLGAYGPRNVQLFIFLIVSDLDVQILGVLLAFDLAVRPSLLQGEGSERMWVLGGGWGVKGHYMGGFAGVGSQMGVSED